MGKGGGALERKVEKETRKEEIKREVNGENKRFRVRGSVKGK